MDLKYIIRISKVEKEYLKSFNNAEFHKAWDNDKYLRIIVSVAKEDYAIAAAICNIKFVGDLNLEELIIFIETGNPYIKTLKIED